MNQILATVAAAVAVFAGTNIDDIIVLTVLFLAHRASGEPRRWQIWVGQYAGTTVLVAASGVAAAGLSFMPEKWVGLLGLIPLGIGVGELVKTVRAHGTGEDYQTIGATSSVAVAGITIAYGADNVSVYAPPVSSVTSLSCCSRHRLARRLPGHGLTVRVVGPVPPL